MSYLSSGAFWGVIIVLIGLSIILREIFHIHFPILRIVFGVLLLYWGIKVIAGGFNRPWAGHSTVMDQSSVTYGSNHREYNIVFGNGNVDLFKMEKPAHNQKMEMNVVFGNGHLILNDSIPVRVDMSSAFGSVESPDKSTSVLGNSIFQTSAYRENEPFLRIKASAVFGRISIECKRW
jgi:predicted membrane protein